MKSISRVLGGKKAKRVGSFFEGSFQRQCFSQGITCIKIPDGCKTFGLGKLVRVKTPFDFFIGFGEKTVFLDTKTFNKLSISFSDLTEHQIMNLKIMRKHALSGYLVWFRENNALVFFDIVELCELKSGKSLKYSEGVYLGTIEKFDLKILFTTIFGMN